MISKYKVTYLAIFIVTLVLSAIISPFILIASIAMILPLLLRNEIYKFSADINSPKLARFAMSFGATKKDLLHFNIAKNKNFYDELEPDQTIGYWERIAQRMQQIGEEKPINPTILLLFLVNILLTILLSVTVSPFMALTILPLILLTLLRNKIMKSALKGINPRRLELAKLLGAPPTSWDNEPYIDHIRKDIKNKLSNPENPKHLLSLLKALEVYGEPVPNKAMASSQIALISNLLSKESINIGSLVDKIDKTISAIDSLSENTSILKDENTSILKALTNNINNNFVRYMIFSEEIYKEVKRLTDESRNESYESIIYGMCENNKSLDFHNTIKYILEKKTDENSGLRKMILDKIADIAKNYDQYPNCFLDGPYLIEAIRHNHTGAVKAIMSNSDIVEGFYTNYDEKEVLTDELITNLPHMEFRKEVLTDELITNLPHMEFRVKICNDVIGLTDESSNEIYESIIFGMCENNKILDFDNAIIHILENKTDENSGLRKMILDKIADIAKNYGQYPKCKLHLSYLIAAIQHNHIDAVTAIMSNSDIMEGYTATEKGDIAKELIKNLPPSIEFNKNRMNFIEKLVEQHIKGEITLSDFDAGPEINTKLSYNSRHNMKNLMISIKNLPSDLANYIAEFATDNALAEQPPKYDRLQIAMKYRLLCVPEGELYDDRLQFAYTFFNLDKDLRTNIDKWLIKSHKDKCPKTPLELTADKYRELIDLSNPNKTMPGSAKFVTNASNSTEKPGAQVENKGQSNEQNPKPEEKNPFSP